MTMFTREDWTLFQNLDTLGQKAGVSKEKIPALIAKELVDNALDLGGNCSIGIQEDWFYVEDDGHGIDPGRIPDLFSISRPLVSSKLLRLPTRGALGNGLRVVTGAVIALNGQLHVSSRGYVYKLIPREDGTTEAVPIKSYDKPGTRISVNLNIKPDLTWAERAIAMSTGSIYKGKTSAHWYTSEAFFELAQAAKDSSVRDLVELFDGCTGSKAGKIAADFKNRDATSLTREEADMLLAMMREHSSQVKTDRLGCVGQPEHLPAHYAKTAGAFTIKSIRGNFDAEIPFIVEIWTELTNEPEVLTCVNKTPITGEIITYHSKSEQEFWGCGLSYVIPVGRRPVKVHLNINTPYQPITTDGKEPDFKPMFNAIMDTLLKAAGKAKKNAPALYSKKKDQKEVVLERLEEGIAKASGDGQYRYSLRQIFYAVRPYVIDESGVDHDPGYDYFSKIIAQYESEYGNIPGMYRDPRGIVYHPHLSQTIPLGTIAVENYTRPAWTFNKVIYIEKEGFFETLISDRWPEKNDCALLTAKGQATAAAKDLIDLLGDSEEEEEELLFFCIHDADAAGTMIYQALQEGTLSRPGRKVKVINLGLEPWEAIEMGLPKEKVERRDKNRRAPVAEYVSSEWATWLQSYRVELNAMTTPQFLEWLNNKMNKFGQGKLIPPEKILTKRLKESAVVQIEEKVRDKILHDAGYNKIVKETVENAIPILEKISGLKNKIAVELKRIPEHSWKTPVDDEAKEIIENYVLR